MKSSKLCSAASVLIFTLAIHVEANEGSCAKAKVVSGETCSNVKVEFDFSACGHNEKKLVERVACEGQNIMARTTFNQYRYEAKFKKVDDGWGAVNWTSLGEVTAMKKPGAPAVAEIIPLGAPAASTAERSPAANYQIPVTPPEPPAAPAPETPAAATTVSGYVDALYQVNLNGRTSVVGRTFDPLASLLSVQWAEIAFERTRGPLKAHVEFAFGDAVDRYTGIETPGRGDNINQISTGTTSPVPIAQNKIYDPLNNVPSA
ncbi:MAG: porin [Bdellovibrionales bacterium]|nr:porin [Bdellovibrionales bacterium]